MEYDVKKLKELVEQKDVAAIKEFMAKHDLEVVKGRIVPKPAVIAEFKVAAAHWNQRQQARKILLNSLN